MEKEIVNKVAQSSLVTLHPKDFLPSLAIESFDMKEFLFMGMVLKEKDFRKSLKELDWEKFRGKNVALFCSSDALIPSWAYMLVGSYLPNSSRVCYSSPDALKERLIEEHLDNLDFEKYRDAKIVLKGCGEGEIPQGLYLSLSRRLLPLVRSLMYGEACSAVPVYKRRNL
jgi:hypothetical protein